MADNGLRPIGLGEETAGVRDLVLAQADLPGGDEEFYVGAAGVDDPGR